MANNCYVEGKLVSFSEWGSDIFGQPGVTHDAVLMGQETGGMTLRKASAPTDAPSVAQAIGAILAEVSEGAWR